MNIPATLVPLVLLVGWGTPKAAPLRITFDNSKDVSKQTWKLDELHAQLPSDWSNYQFLVMELKASSPQMFQLSIETANGPATVRFLPYSNVWVRAAVPLSYFEKLPTKGTDMASISNKTHIGYFINLSGPYRPLEAVTGSSVSMQNPLRGASLEIRSIAVTRDSPGDAVLENHPLVDQFGQWIDGKWPGKVKSAEELKRDWAQEADSLQLGGYEYCAYGGYRNTKARATGFFRVEQINGRWWFVDPDGHLFFSTGADVTTPAIATPTEGRQSIFEALPPDNLNQPGLRGGASFLTWNLFRRFGDDWQSKWVDFTIRRMQSWGLNTTGNWSSPQLWNSHRVAYTVPLRGWETKVNYMGMPDVYSDEFVETCDRAAAEQCSRRARDPYLLGYFTANEPPWPGREEALVEMILDGPDTATRRELKKFLAEGDTPQRRKSFVYQAYGRYLDVILQAVKKHDPNHLNLGMRFAGGRAPDEMIKASRVFDVYSLNSYDYVPRREMLEHAYELTGRPLMIGEFHFGVPGRGLSAGLRQAANDRERGVAYRYYMENAAAMPALIGAHWFQWMDEPNTGRFDGENYNIGFVDVTDRPYKDFLEEVKETQKLLYAVHSGERAPSSKQARVH
ncbi:MAG: hypothetical protein WAM39_16555 [Bryobacteraceae bacterium]